MEGRNNILEKEMTKGTPHKCGGQLKLINGPVQAGSERGGEFYLYECSECHEIVVVGGKKINYPSSRTQQAA